MGLIGVNSLPKTVTRQRRDYDLNLGWLVGWLVGVEFNAPLDTI